MTFRFDPSASGFFEDPYPTYKILRDDHPAYYDETTRCWLITRYADVARVLTESNLFSSARGNVIMDSPLRVGRTLGSMDPPRHDELRRVIMRGVTPARIEAMLGPMRDHTRRVIHALAARRECDVVADIGRPILYGALGRMLGLDDAAADKAAEISKPLFNAGLGPTGSPLKPEGFQAVFDFISEEMNKRKTSRGDDMISVLLDAKENGAPLSDAEIVANTTTVLLAGNASIGHFFPNLIYSLWRHPDQRRAVLADVSKIESAIEEGVRWDTSTQCFARQTTAAADIAGTTIPEASRVVAFYASANRDERAIADPDRFQIDRDKVRHFGFGAGPHHCLGASTARRMLNTMLGEILPVIGDFELDIANAARVRHLMVRGFSALPMRW